MNRPRKLEALQLQHEQTKLKARLFTKYQMKQLHESNGQCILGSFWDADKDEGFVKYYLDNTPPGPPPCRLVCLACGDITKTGKHTSILCKLSLWFDKVFKRDENV